MMDATTLLFILLVLAGLILGLTRAQESKSRREQWGWIAATLGSVVGFCWWALITGHTALLVSVIVALITAAFAMGPFITIVRGVQDIKHFGWNSRRGLVWWDLLLGGLFGAYLELEFIVGRPSHTPSMLGTTSVAVGLVWGSLLVRKPPQWPTRPAKPMGLVFRFLILACIVAFVWFMWWEIHPYHIPLTGDVLMGLLLIAFWLIHSLIEIMYPERDFRSNDASKPEAKRS